MDTLLALVAALINWGLCLVLVFRIIPAAVTAVAALRARHPLARASASVRMTWSAR